MAVKNALPCNFHITAGFDGYYRGDDPTGARASGYQTAPTLLHTDKRCVSLTGNENNKGSFFTLIGYSFGRRADLGTAAGAQVWLRDAAGDNIWYEVDNYRFWQLSRNFTRNQTICIGVQVGSLGGAQVAGRTLDVSITVNGVRTNILSGSGIAQGGITNQPGRTAYVSLTGDDATAMFDDPTKPFRYLQHATGVVQTAGSLWDDVTNMGEQGMRPGDHIVMRGGTYTDITGTSGKFFRPFDHSGTVPTGQSGTKQIRVTGAANNGSGLVRLTVASTIGFTTGEIGNVYGVRGTSEANGAWTITVVDATHIDLQGSTFANVYSNSFQGQITNASGHICIGAYPGPVGGNAPEVVFYDGPTNSGGGFHGPQSTAGAARAGRFITISGIKCFMAAGATATDASPFSLGYALDSSGWRIIDCEASWPSTLPAPLSAGIEIGSQSGVTASHNYIHDVYGASLQNHGIYCATEDNNGNFPASDNEISYNWIEDITGGSFVQFYTSRPPLMERNVVKHNFCKTSGKYGFNFSNNCKSASAFNNTLIGTPFSAFQFGDQNLNTLDIDVSFNTCYNCCYTTGWYVIDFDENVSVGSVSITHNIFVLSPTNNCSGWYTSFVDTNITLDQNLYYDRRAVRTTPPAKDANAIYGDPLFTDIANDDLTLSTGSPALNAVTTTPAYAATVDFYGVARPQSTNKDIGACEGVGT